MIISVRERIERLQASTITEDTCQRDKRRRETISTQTTERKADGKSLLPFEYLRDDDLAKLLAVNNIDAHGIAYKEASEIIERSHYGCTVV